MNSSTNPMETKRMVVLIEGTPATQADNEERMSSASQLSQIALNPLTTTNKDSRWLTLEVCREFQRGKCSRSEQDCKFAHPPPHVEVNNGKVVACFDNLKGRCQRVSPPCKYLHPPQHLKDILQQNGRNNLILRSLALNMAGGNVQFSGAATTATPILATNGTAVGNNAPTFLAASLGGHTIATPANGGQAAFLHSLSANTAPVQFAYAAAPTALAAMIAGQNHTLATAQTAPTFLAINPSYAGTGIPLNFQSPQNQMFEPASFQAAFFQNQSAGTPAAFIPSYLTVRQPQPTAIRTDRLEVCKDFQQGICPYSGATCQFAHPPAHCPVDRDGLVTVCVDYVKGKCTRDSCKYFHPPEHLVAQLKVLSNHQQSICAGSYPTVFCSAVNPTASAIANQRFVTAMMLAGGSATPGLQHSPAMSTNAGLLSTGGFFVAGPQTTPAFFPGAILTSAGQARPTIITPNQQFISTLTYLPSKRQALDEIVSSAAKKRSYEETITLQQQQLQPNQGLLQCYESPPASSSYVSSSASVQTGTPQAAVDTNETVQNVTQDIKSSTSHYELSKTDYEGTHPHIPSVEQYTQTANSSASYTAKANEYVTSIE